ncbi:MAG: glucose-6-phosphate isomerase [Candidatus Krumholzibacteriia bacterium]
MIEHEGIRLDISGAGEYLPASELEALEPRALAALAELHDGTGPGADYLGWLDLPSSITADDLGEIRAEADRIAAQAEVLAVVGIGGSYLGARAVLAALGLDGRAGSGRPEVIFAGTGLCGATLQQTLDRLGDRDVHVCVISKSGTTLEPAVAFRILRARLAARYGAGAPSRITAVTDARRGALRRLAEAEGYATFVIPDDVGGRFSVLTPVGLVPLAAAGVDVAALVDGARSMAEFCRSGDLRANPALLYATVRYGLYAKGFTTEILSSFHGGLQLMQEWWKQLFGESEGKQGRGIFPASTVFTTDLHSLGQYIQDGRRVLQETFLAVRETGTGLAVPCGAGEGSDPDGLDYLAGRSLDEINWKAYEGTRTAHLAGGVPCLGLELDRVDARTLGALIYMFELAVGVGGKLLGVNPFDQPGVETYKKEMFRLLGKP